MFKLHGIALKFSTFVLFRTYKWLAINYFVFHATYRGGGEKRKRDILLKAISALDATAIVVYYIHKYY